MRVVHIFWALGYGGIETMLVNIANEQARQGAEVCIVIINDMIAEELQRKISREVELVRIGRTRGSKSLAFSKRLNQELDRLCPDVIHLHYSSIYNYLSRRWRRNMSCSVCSTLHAMPHGTCGMAWLPGRMIQNLLFGQGGNVVNLNRIGKVFAISHSVADALKSDFGVDSTVVCNGIHTDMFKRREWVKPDEVFEIVQVSRLVHEKKGQDLLIEAVAKLAEQNYNLHVSFIGDGDSREYLESLAEELGVQSYISFLGTKPQDYLKDHLCEYDLFVQPSRYEGFGLTVAEAMAACVPVLVSSNQGPAEVTENDKYGWVFENGNVDDLTNQLRFLVENYGQCLDKVQPAREHVTREYDVSVTAKRYLEAYKKV